MEGRGTLVANDRSVQRMSALGAVIARLGLVNVTCTNTDGARYPLSAGPFDRVLVDAPCSAEGNAFKNASWRGSDEAFRAFVSGTQRALLRRAALLCRTGGRVVYSTCTFAPEENEAVIDAVLRELEGALRLGPHRSGTGGFCAAVLEKTRPIDGEAAQHAGAAVSELGLHPRESDVLARFTSAFGFGEDAFDGHRLLTGGRFARLVADDHVIPTGAPRVSTGLPITRNGVHGTKLSTAGALAFGRKATSRVIELDAGEAARFEAREALPRSSAPDGVTRGYVIARTAGHPLGVGLVRDDERGLRLESEFPSAWSRLSTPRAD
jgi:hypothetical protein